MRELLTEYRNEFSVSKERTNYWDTQYRARFIELLNSDLKEAFDGKAIPEQVLLLLVDHNVGM